MHKWQRICVIGGSGSGKSTLASALSEHYKIPAYHLDRELLHGQFEPLPLEEQQRRHAKIISDDAWVIDGSYAKLLDDRLARAELVVFLNVSRLRTIPRVLRRYLKNEHRRDSVPDVARNAMSAKFLWWCLKYSRRSRYKKLEVQCKKYAHLTLVSLPRDSVDGWVRTIDALL